MKALKFLQSVMNEVTAPLRTELKETIPIGVILPFYGTVAPKSYLLCDGSEFDKDKYKDLYTILGSGTLPDLRNKTVMGGGTLGAVSNGAIPNIVGGDIILPTTATSPFKYIRKQDDYAGTLQGGIRNQYSIDLSLQSPLYKNGQSYIEPANIRVSFIIRAK